jgi:molecular chaperone GrpE (heat shock protein)
MALLACADEEEELAAIQEDIRAALNEIEEQQLAARSPHYDISGLRRQRRDINAEFQQVKVQFNKDRVRAVTLASPAALMPMLTIIANVGRACSSCVRACRG